jgi:hypothetical protein
MSDRHQNQVSQRRGQLLTVLEPRLLPAERVELVSFAMVGKTPVKKNVAALAVSAAAAAATGGTMIAISARRSYYVILTNQRLLVVANDRRSGGFGTIKLAARREAVTPTVLANGFFVKARLDIQGSQAPLRISYAAARPSKKAEGRALIAALGNSSAAEAAAY